MADLTDEEMNANVITIRNNSLERFFSENLTRKLSERDIQCLDPFSDEITILKNKDIGIGDIVRFEFGDCIRSRKVDVLLTYKAEKYDDISIKLKFLIMDVIHNESNKY